MLKAFLSNWQPANTGSALTTFELPLQVSQEAVQRVVAAVYSSKLAVEPEMVGEWFAIADYLAVEALSVPSSVAPLAQS